MEWRGRYAIAIRSSGREHHVRIEVRIEGDELHSVLGLISVRIEVRIEGHAKRNPRRGDEPHSVLGLVRRVEGKGSDGVLGLAKVGIEAVKVLTPVMASMLTPVAASVITPVVASLLTHIAASMLTPVVASVLTPVTTSVLTPIAASVLTPVVTSVLTPVAAPVITPIRIVGAQLRGAIKDVVARFVIEVCVQESVDVVVGDLELDSRVVDDDTGSTSTTDKHLHRDGVVAIRHVVSVEREAVEVAMLVRAGQDQGACVGGVVKVV